MNKSGPIVFIEDDMDDQQLMASIFRENEFENPILFFNDGEAALKYLTETEVEPFIIFSDINMPKLNGMELRNKVHNNDQLRLKCTPYLFFTTTAEQRHVIDAYSKSIQGFFVKPSSYEKLKELISITVKYWQECESPNYTR